MVNADDIGWYCGMFTTQIATYALGAPQNLEKLARPGKKEVMPMHDMTMGIAAEVRE